MIEWITSLPWLQIISIGVAFFVAVTSYLYARKALARANKANKIAEKALSKIGDRNSTRHSPESSSIQHQIDVLKLTEKKKL